MKIKQNIKLKNVEKHLKRDSGLYGRVVLGQHLGWTHDFKDCNCTKQIPLTRYGSPMMENSTKDYINKDAIMKHAAYGPHPVDTLMAMHFKNFEASKEEVGSLETQDFIDAVETEISLGNWVPESS